MQSNGFIYLHRKLAEWEWYSDVPAKVVFLHLLIMANHKDNKWRGVVVERGQLITSISHLAKSIGISAQSTRTALTKLKSTNEITIKTTNRFTVISVNNYNEYQKSTSDTTNEQQTTNKQLTTNKNDKNDKNNTNSIAKIPAVRKYASIDDLTSSVVAEIAQQYSVTPQAVSKELESLRLYCLSKGLTYKDYKATLQGWVRRKIDEGKIKQGRTPQEGKVAGVLESLEKKYANN